MTRTTLLALAASTMLVAHPAVGALPQRDDTLRHGGTYTPVPCDWRSPPTSVFEREDRIFRCGQPRKVKHCEPVFVPSWRTVFDHCRFREVWGR